jgi:hypothetical protein
MTSVGESLRLYDIRRANDLLFKGVDRDMRTSCGLWTPRDPSIEKFDERVASSALSSTVNQHAFDKFHGEDDSAV